VHHLRRDLLAGPRGAADQNGTISAGDPVDKALQLLERSRVTYCLGLGRGSLAYEAAISRMGCMHRLGRPLRRQADLAFAPGFQRLRLASGHLCGARDPPATATRDNYRLSHSSGNRGL
jgi:hypothetical protein